MMKSRGCGQKASPKGNEANRHASRHLAAPGIATYKQLLMTDTVNVADQADPRTHILGMEGVPKEEIETLLDLFPESS